MMAGGAGWMSQVVRGEMLLGEESFWWGKDYRCSISSSIDRSCAEVSWIWHQREI
jgi:hypothetical protein